MTPKRTMIELAEFWGSQSFALCNIRPKPGGVVMHLPPEQRELLKNLKSEDLSDIRVQPWFQSWDLSRAYARWY